ncbi:hypothetical protein BJ742DRAFT_870616 [Cladochytrium replicatum]|nr:hypothetical protein BJ742DRAFT_870616 [Cladochytrium replicatum]
MFNWFFARDSSASTTDPNVLADEWIIVDENQHPTSEHKSDRPVRSTTQPTHTPITPTLPPTVSSSPSSSASQMNSPIYKLAISTLPSSASPPNAAMRASPGQLSGASQDILVRMRDREQKQKKMQKRSTQTHKPHHNENNHRFRLSRLDWKARKDLLHHRSAACLPNLAAASEDQTNSAGTLFPPPLSPTTQIQDDTFDFDEHPATSLQWFPPKPSLELTLDPDVANAGDTPFARFSNDLNRAGDDHSLALGAFMVFVSSLTGPTHSVETTISDPMILDSDQTPCPMSDYPCLHSSFTASLDHADTSLSLSTTPSMTDSSPSPSFNDRSLASSLPVPTYHNDFFFLSFHLRGRGVFPMPIRRPTVSNKQQPSTAGRHTRSFQGFGNDWSTASIFSTHTTQSA